MKIITSRPNVSLLFLSLLMMVFVQTGLISHAYAFSQINSQLDLGAKSVEVTRLQEFLAANPAVYPEGLVTGYFGALTRAAVLRFQAQNGIAQVGRVGPQTKNKINSLIATGGWQVADVSGPAFYNSTLVQSGASATFNFTTDEMTTARVVFSTAPLQSNEGDINSNGFGPIGGYATYSSSGLNRAHTVTLNNLQSSTSYYYTIIATDAMGNASVVGPNTTFHTN